MPSPIVNEYLIEQLLTLLEKPVTIAKIKEKTGASKSTIYRYFGKLQGRGYFLQRDGLTRPTLYYVE